MGEAQGQTEVAFGAFRDTDLSSGASSSHMAMVPKEYRRSQSSINAQEAKIGAQQSHYDMLHLKEEAEQKALQAKYDKEYNRKIGKMKPQEKGSQKKKNVKK